MVATLKSWSLNSSSDTMLLHVNLCRHRSKLTDSGDQVLSQQDHMVQDTLSAMSGADFSLKESTSLLIDGSEVRWRTLYFSLIFCHSYSSLYSFLYLAFTSSFPTLFLKSGVAECSTPVKVSFFCSSDVSSP